MNRITIGDAVFESDNASLTVNSHPLKTMWVLTAKYLAVLLLDKDTASDTLLRYPRSMGAFGSRYLPRVYEKV